MTRPTTAVVICAYTLERWTELSNAVASAAAQDPPPDELLLVVDHNDVLLRRAREELVVLHRSLQVVPNHRKQGLAGARNSGLEVVRTEIVVFLDDDAAAEPGWLSRLVAPYEDEAVLAVGGSAIPSWPSGATRPATLPAPAAGTRGELDWVVGCTYQGQPTSLGPIRNLMGCNMSLRTAVFAAVGGFNEDLGRVGRTPLGCEETELCIRASSGFPDSTILFEPAAVVHHTVSSDRLTWKYLVRRSAAEGISKAAVATIVGPGAALSTERGYVASILPAGVLRQIRGTARPRASIGAELAGAAAIVLALAATTVGYARGRLLGRGAFESARLHAGPRLVVHLPGESTSVAADRKSHGRAATDD